MERLRYLTDFYDEKIARIREIDAPLNFIFITDQHNMFRHSTVEAVESMQYILDRCPNIQCVISGGDMTAEAAWVRLSWALAQTEDAAEVRALLAQPLPVLRRK